MFFLFFCDSDMKYDVFHCFKQLTLFQNVKNTYRVVLVLLRRRVRATQNSISVQVFLCFVMKHLLSLDYLIPTVI